DRRPRRRERYDDRDDERGRTPPGSAFLIVAAVVAAVGLLGLVGVVAIGLMSDGAKPRPAPSLPVVKVGREQLVEDWNKNPVAALSRYQGKAVEVTGHVRSIDAGKYVPSLVIKVKTDRLIDPSMTVRVPDSMVSELANYPVGSQITMQVEFTEAG